MKHAEIVRSAEVFVKKQLENEGSGHDWWHIERVRNNARNINNKENADWFIVELAVLLHDVGDRKVIGKEEDDYSIAENFLISQDVDQQSIDHIMFIIKNMSFNKSLDGGNIQVTKEFQVVQDADRLDAIGAIGIARAFTYGGNKSRPMHNPTQKVRQLKSSQDYYQISNSSSFNHFEEKLFKLKDLMSTKTAKAIAKERHNYMKAFTTQFLEEWDGKK